MTNSLITLHAKIEDPAGPALDPQRHDAGFGANPGASAL